MKIFIFSFLFVSGVFAQLPRPVLIGECNFDEGRILLSLQKGNSSLTLQKKGKTVKSCAIELINSASLHRGFERVNFYYRLSACDRRLLSEKGFSAGPLLREGLLVVESHPPKVSGLANSLTGQKNGLVCAYSTKSWAKVVELGKKSRRR